MIWNRKLNIIMKNGNISDPQSGKKGLRDEKKNKTFEYRTQYGDGSICVSMRKFCRMKCIGDSSFGQNRCKELCI